MTHCQYSTAEISFPASRGNNGGLFHLAQQLDRAPSSECGHPTGGINRHGAQKLGQLACCAGIEAAIGAMRQPSDLTEDLLDISIVALLEHEGRHSENARARRRRG